MDSNSSQQKHCYVCQRTLLTSEFHKDKYTKDGLRNQCKSCVKTHNAAFKSTVAYKEIAKLRMRQWRAAHTEKSRAWATRWQKEHPAERRRISRAARQRRRARMHNTISTLTHQEWEDRVQEFNGHCAYCLKPFDNLQMEHMQPISKGGMHTLDNIIPACRSCNAMKGDRTLLEFISTSLS